MPFNSNSYYNILYEIISYYLVYSFDVKRVLQYLSFNFHSKIETKIKFE